MQTLLLVTLMFLFTASAALIWLTIRAFKTTPGWGFAVMLLSPVSATVFGVKFWERQREPFLLFITTFTATFALTIYLLTVTGGVGLLKLSYNLIHGISPQSTLQSMRAGAMHASYSVDQDGDAMYSNDSAFQDINSADSDAQEPSNQQAEKKEKSLRYRLAYVPVKISDVRKYVGTTAKVTRKNVGEKEYVITGATPKSIEVSQRSRHGKFSFSFKHSDIEQVRVLINEAY